MQECGRNDPQYSRAGSPRHPDAGLSIFPPAIAERELSPLCFYAAAEPPRQGSKLGG